MRAYKKANREQASTYNRNWHRKNPEFSAAKDASRRAKTNLSNIDCDMERDDIKLFYSIRNSYSRVTGIPHHIDHIEALANGGEHRMYNLDILTASDNCSKGVNNGRRRYG